MASSTRLTRTETNASGSARRTESWAKSRTSTSIPGGGMISAPKRKSNPPQACPAHSQIGSKPCARSRAR